MSDLTTAKLLARLYAAGCGYCHYRSARLTDVEASRLIEEIGARGSAAEVLDTSLDKVRRWHTAAVGTPVFCRQERIPDPDNPHRNARVLWLWVSDGSADDTARAAAALLDPGLPRTEKEARDSGWLLVRGVPAAKDPHTPEVPAIPPSSVRGSEPRRPPVALRRWVTPAIGVLTLAVFSVWLTFKPRQGTDTTNPPPPPRSSRWVDPEWDETRTIILKRLRDNNGPWVDNQDDQRLLLDQFVELFRRPDIARELLTTNEERESYSKFIQPVPRQPHPFLDFLERLPQQLPVVADDDPGGSWGVLASQRLEPLAQQLRPSDLKKPRHPMQLVRELRDERLDYPGYFESWKKDHPDYSQISLWYQGVGRSPAWEVRVRKHLQAKYNPDHR